MITEAIILAGGFGTRLQHILPNVPKPMAPIGDSPFLSILLDELSSFGITDVVLSTGYLHEQIEEYYHNDYQGIKLSYAHETEPLGTGGAIKYALSFCKTEKVFILNGDTLFRVNLHTFAAFHQQHNSDLSIALRQVDDVSRYGSVSISPDGKILNFKEKNSDFGKGLINGGIYLLKKNILDNISAKTFSFEKDFMEKYYTQQLFYGYPCGGYFIDIGVPEDYARAVQKLGSNKTDDPSLLFNKLNI
jgi:D-glycero-alpha-D-manno-heptose 1-phosphate guanylyltransferase